MAHKKRSPEELRAIHAKIEQLKKGKGGVKAYDVKAKMMASMKEGTEHTITLKNGRIAVQGESIKSGNKITRIIG